MAKTKKGYSPSASVAPFFGEQMKDPAFRREYKALEPEFAIIQQIINLRIKHKMSQTQLAKRIGTHQPSIARLESQKRIRNLDYLQRVANALDADVQVRLVPRTASATNHRRTAKKV